jgi:hypothetical protein
LKLQINVCGGGVGGGVGDGNGCNCFLVFFRKSQQLGVGGGFCGGDGFEYYFLSSCSSFL